MKLLLNINRINILSATEQKIIQGGVGCPAFCNSDGDCSPCNDTAFDPVNWRCINYQCVAW